MAVEEYLPVFAMIARFRAGKLCSMNPSTSFSHMNQENMSFIKKKNPQFLRLKKIPWQSNHNNHHSHGVLSTMHRCRN
jgi:hypothetical protein